MREEGGGPLRRIEQSSLVLCTLRSQFSFSSTFDGFKSLYVWFGLSVCE